MNRPPTVTNSHKTHGDALTKVKSAGLLFRKRGYFGNKMIPAFPGPPAGLKSALMQTDLFHGGDLAWAEDRFGRPEEGWIDLSTGINPWPYEGPVNKPYQGPREDRAFSPAVLSRLPSRSENISLREAAAACYGAPGAHCVACAPGTQSIIQILPRLRPAGSKVCVLGPTYAEHEACWRAGGHRVEAVTDIQRLNENWDVVVAVNPNNPDGRILEPGFLLGLADRLAIHDGLLVVDEAFADSVPAISLAGHADRPGLIVLRSFGKFFGLAGLRLGFALAAPGNVFALSRELGPWAVSGPALALGGRALSDKAWIEETRNKLEKAGENLKGLLCAKGLKDLGGTALFRLAGHRRAQNLFERLGRAGILVRPFAEAPDRLRFGLPASKKDRARLAAALGVL